MIKRHWEDHNKWQKLKDLNKIGSGESNAIDSSVEIKQNIIFLGIYVKKQNTSCDFELRAQIYELRVKIASYKFKSTSYEFKSTRVRRD